MAPQTIPNDPRTWTDWRDPESHGLVKVDLDTPFESALLAGVWAGCLGALIILWADIRSTRGGGFLRWPDPWALLLALVALAVAAVCGGLKLMTDNFYLIDPGRHLVYAHAKVGFARRVRLWLERKDILSVSTETRLIQRGYRSWAIDDDGRVRPQQRVVLIGREGRLVPFSNWEFDAAWPSNNKAAELAQQLECPYHEAPDNCRLVVTMRNGSASVSFRPFTRWDRLDRGTLYIIGSIALVGLGGFAVYFLGLAR